MKLQEFLKILMATAREEFVALIDCKEDQLILTFPDKTQIKVSAQVI